MDRREYPRGDLAEVLQLDVFVGDPRLFLEALHHGVVQVSLGREVPVHGALADAGALRHGPEGQALPVPAVEAVHELGSRVDDALAGLGGLLPAPRAVVATARRNCIFAVP